MSRSQFHNALEADLTLLSDYQAGVECLPTKLLQVAEAHTDEVWHVSFSNSGTMLASCSKVRLYNWIQTSFCPHN